MYKESSFKLNDLIVVIACILLVAFTFVLPAWTGSVGRSRAAVCRNNMKLIGVGLELWEQHAGRYPPWDWPGLSGNPANLCPWLDALAIQNGYTLENLEAHRDDLKYSLGLEPEDFIKTVDDDKIFMCPSDHPHPHRINQMRADAWAFNPLEYSYSINSCLIGMSHGQVYAKDESSQVLSVDGLWTWSMNLSGYWVTDPNSAFDTGGWYCNTVGYWHKRNAANFLLRDLHIENHSYPPDTNEIYYGEPGEELNSFYF